MHDNSHLRAVPIEATLQPGRTWLDQIAPHLGLDNEGALSGAGAGAGGSCGCLGMPVAELPIQGAVVDTLKEPLKVRCGKLLSHEGHLHELPPQPPPSLPMGPLTSPF